MDLRHLRFFVAVAEELHFTRAAAREHVAQPHLSQEIRRLEREIGVQLFVRDRRHVNLTAAGKAFLVQARAVLAGAAEAVRAAQRAGRGETGSLRIGFASSVGFGSGVLTDAIRRYRAARPDVEILVHEMNSKEQVEAIGNGQLDIGLLHPPRPVEPGLEIETLLAVPLAVALPEGHRLARRRSVALAQLSEDPWVIFPRWLAPGLHDSVMAACAAAGFAPRIVQETTRVTSMLSLVASGFGVSLVPVSVARVRLWGTLCRPLEDGLALPLALVWRKSDANPPLDHFLQAVRDEARRFDAASGWKRAGTRPTLGGLGAKRRSRPEPPRVRRRIDSGA